MSYQNSNRSSMNRGSSAVRTQDTGAAAKTGARKAIFSTGLFSPNKEGVKAIGSVQLKEDVVIPAGSYINLYESDSKNEKAPAFRIQVTEGKLKSAK